MLRAFLSPVHKDMHTKASIFALGLLIFISWAPSLPELPFISFYSGKYIKECHDYTYKTHHIMPCE